jgi:hypothetical protein
LGCGDEIVPSLAAGIDDGVVIVEHANAELVLTEELPDVFLRIEFGGV